VVNLASATAGTKVNDKATVAKAAGTPASAPAPTGTVTFTFYRGGDCSTGTADVDVPADTVTLVSGVAYPSKTRVDLLHPTLGLPVDSYAFKAHYSGDSYYPAKDSDCEPLTITKVTSEMGTDLLNSDGSGIPPGGEAKTGTVYDKATVIGFNPTGEVTFYFFDNGVACPADGFAGGTELLPAVALDVNHEALSQSVVSLAAGTYNFKAQYSGDGNNTAQDSPCEPFTVAKVTVIKTESVGGTPVDPIKTAYEFELTGGPDNVDIHKWTPPATLDFGVLKAGTYTLCELHVPAGTHSTLEDVVVGGDITGKTINNTTGDVCVTFILAAGEDQVFNINNDRPGGGQRTIGYWKNWNSCSHDGAFVERSVQTGNVLADKFFTLPDYPPIMIGILPVDTCQEAVAILNKTPLDGRKAASDAAYNLAAQLLGAKLNVLAGAGTCPAATNAINNAQTLLANANFNGTGEYWKGGKNAAAERATALLLAGILDNYNNGKLC
jgi:hypothetical protein